jgi:hypothetical protein
LLLDAGLTFLSGICGTKFSKKKFFQKTAAIDSNGRTIWIADAHRDDGKRFVVRADEKLTAFVELERGFTNSRWI